MIQIKRIYDEASPDDGYRILVDRLWPRGVAKERAALDLWLKEIAPSTELRAWYHQHGIEENFTEFATRYEAELADNEAVKTLRGLVREHKVVTLLYAARQPEFNHAKVIVDFLKKHK